MVPHAQKILKHSVQIITANANFGGKVGQASHGR